MPNIRQEIQNSNLKLLKPKENDKSSTNKVDCNCRNKKNCPLGGYCVLNGTNVIYNCDVISKNTTENYQGSTTNFKSRYNGHKSSFKSEKKSTSLASYCKSLIKLNEPFSLKWTIINSCTRLHNNNGECNLCNLEKAAILENSPTLNKKNEILGACMHSAERNCWYKRFRKKI